MFQGTSVCIIMFLFDRIKISNRPRRGAGVYVQPLAVYKTQPSRRLPHDKQNTRWNTEEDDEKVTSVRLRYPTLPLRPSTQCPAISNIKRTSRDFSNFLLEPVTSLQCHVLDLDALVHGAMGPEARPRPLGYDPLVDAAALGVAVGTPGLVEAALQAIDLTCHS